MSESGVDTSKKVAQELSKVLADSFTVYQKTHGYHWNVRGPNFRGLHLLLEEQYNEIWTSIDEIAERIRALDQFAPMGAAAFGSGLSTRQRSSWRLAATTPLADGLVARYRSKYSIARVQSFSFRSVCPNAYSASGKSGSR